MYVTVASQQAVVQHLSEGHEVSRGVPPPPLPSGFVTTHNKLWRRMGGREGVTEPFGRLSCGTEGATRWEDEGVSPNHLGGSHAREGVSGEVKHTLSVQSPLAGNSLRLQKNCAPPLEDPTWFWQCLNQYPESYLDTDHSDRSLPVRTG
jgi:hypothetical protein